MDISSLLGMSRKPLEIFNEDFIVSKNTINNTVELSNVTSPLSSKPCHGLFYYDLIEQSLMTMAIVKVEKYNKVKLLNYRLFGGNKNKSYIETITKIDNNNLVIAYIHENVVKAM